MLGRPARASLLAAGLVTAAVFGAACREGDDASGVTTVLQTATTYATVPLRSTTTVRGRRFRPTPTGEPAPTTVDRSVEQPYEIQSGDYLAEDRQQVRRPATQALIELQRLERRA